MLLFSPRAWRSLASTSGAMGQRLLPPETALVAARPSHRQQDCPARLSHPPGLAQPMISLLHWNIPPHHIPSLEIFKVTLERALGNLI